MENDYKFQKGDKVKVKRVDPYLSFHIKYKRGAVGFVNDTSCIPFIVFENTAFNYTSRGTAVHEDDLELISDEQS